MTESQPQDDTPELSATELRRIDLVADEFERAWLQGPPPAVEAYLGRVEAPLRAALKEELLRIDREWRCRREEGVPGGLTESPDPAAMASLAPGPSRPVRPAASPDTSDSRTSAPDGPSVR